MAKAYGVTPVRSLKDCNAHRVWEGAVLAHLTSASEDPTDSLPLAQAVALFLDDMLHAGYHLETVRRWWYYFKIFLEWCAGQGLARVEQIGPDTVRRFLGYLKRDRQLGPRSLSGYFARLFFFLRNLTDKGVLPFNPMQGMRIKTASGKAAQLLLSEEEVRGLFRAIRQYLADLPPNYPGFRFTALRDRVILELMLATGLRVSEVAAIRVGDVDSERGTLHISGKGSHRFFKRNRTAFLDVEPLHSHLREYLSVRGGSPDAPVFPSREDGGVLTPASFDVLVKRWARRAGISRRIHCHMFRHTFCTHLISHGADVFTVQRLMGHWAVETTLEYYLHLTPGEVRSDWQQHNPLARREGQSWR